MAERISRRAFLRIAGAGVAACAAGTSDLGSTPARGRETPPEFPELKKTLIKLRADLSEAKRTLVSARKAGRKAGPEAADFSKKSRAYRHHLIAYSELRGKKREEIEKPGRSNRPNEAEIARIKRLFGPKTPIS
jgi:hypothetical protein